MVPQRTLAGDLHISPPTASNTLKQMERDGWIQRLRDESDQ
ncbi:MAG: MarR family transcriptional regulator [Deltaproteobacteria bacterium]|nr:MarR family transcriptional regulator [Deltaproteobacteria bacterium]MBT4265340.1 MarR family transcriptional regulator [Deltaproteobacteria bacterium]MBT4638794.1 MarR family transcriptional regulator [Deltaproteobacteria bacterium]MBT6502194.1 MarR family transcriptional regulator [Deltaproteobacteria bacterium]MBT6616036.1 MarR family transcriptional regulator [Deltaproteobacteria bacterium]